jgi:ParB family chromosome partitioning protein
MTEEKAKMPSRSKRGLGRGLDALFEAEKDPGVTDLSRIEEMDINRLEPNRDQPRRDFDESALAELTGSIRDQGVISPLIVTPTPDSEYYMIVAGERRWRAARMAGLSTVPVIVRELTKEDVQRQALVDNIVRQDLNAMEEAEAFDRLIREYGMTQEELASALGKSRPAVTNTMRLLNLPDAIREMVRQGELSPGHARAILALKDASSQSTAAAEILKKELSVRDAEKLVRDIKEPAAKKPAKTQKDAKWQLHLRDLEDKLRRALGARVTLQGGEGPGKIVISYHTAEERERLIDQLLG